MKLRRDSAESGDCSGPKGEFNKVSAGRNRIEIPSGLKIVAHRGIAWVPNDC
jgi:hypothetical protein